MLGMLTGLVPEALIESALKNRVATSLNFFLASIAGKKTSNLSVKVLGPPSRLSTSEPTAVLSVTRPSTRWQAPLACPPRSLLPLGIRPRYLLEPSGTVNVPSSVRGSLPSSLRSSLAARSWCRHLSAVTLQHLQHGHGAVASWRYSNEASKPTEPCKHTDGGSDVAALSLMQAY